MKTQDAWQVAPLVFFLMLENKRRGLEWHVFTFIRKHSDIEPIETALH